MIHAPASLSIPRADEVLPAAPEKKRVDHNDFWDKQDDADSEPRHHADEVRDQGVLESFGRAVTAPVLPGGPAAVDEKPNKP